MHKALNSHRLWILLGLKLFVTQAGTRIGTENNRDYQGRNKFHCLLILVMNFLI